MSNSPFILRKGQARELDSFPHIEEFVLDKNSTIQLDSFLVSTSNHLRIYCVLDGKFEWFIKQKHHVLYPGNVAVVLPSQEFGGSKGYLDIGTLLWLNIQVDSPSSDRKMLFGKWSSLSESDKQTIGKILQVKNLPVLKMKEVSSLLLEMYNEIQNQEMGYQSRFNHLLDSLLILIARQSTRQASSSRDFPGTFTGLEQSLRENLAHPWTVEEMAALVGLGMTAFTEKVKSYTGFSPLTYLINIRISEAIKLLKRPGMNVTEIALETGFYSSQHFSTTFKKLTGHTPGEFRRRSTQNTP